MSDEGHKSSGVSDAEPAAAAAGQRLDSALRSQVEQEVDAALAEAAATAETAVAAGEPGAGGSAPKESSLAAAAEETASDEEARRIMLEEMNELAKSGGPRAGGASDIGAEAKTAVEKTPPQQADQSAAPTAESKADKKSERIAAAETREASQIAAAGAPPGDSAGSTSSPQAGAVQAQADEKASGKEKAAGTEAVAADERKALLEKEGQAKPAAGGKGAARKLASTILAALWRWPLRVGLFALNLLDKPFAWIGPETRDLLGKVGIAAMVLALLMVLAALVVI